MNQTFIDPHQNQPVLRAGRDVRQASAAMILIHGRGAPADDILSLAKEFDQKDFAYIAPQAAQRIWYPNSFLAPIHTNEPWISSAIAVIYNLVNQLGADGIPPERTILLGFSQGACLALEFAARNGRRYGGIVGLSGGLIGPDDALRNYSDTLQNTPIFLGCSDHDYYIPAERVHYTADIFQGLGAEVTMRLYKDMGHTINQDEVGFVVDMMTNLLRN